LPSDISTTIISLFDDARDTGAKPHVGRARIPVSRWLTHQAENGSMIITAGLRRRSATCIGFHPHTAELLRKDTVE
jgi:hypothetical protein